MVSKNKQSYSPPKITTKKIKITTFGTKNKSSLEEGLLMAAPSPYDCLY